MTKKVITDLNRFWNTSMLEHLNATKKRIILVESDSQTSTRLINAMMSNVSAEGICSSGIQIDYKICKSTEEFFKTSPADWDLIVTGCHLSDGSGFDVLSFVRGLRPDVAVIMIGGPEESSIAVEAIRAGAADFLLLTGYEEVTFPVTVQKCFALQSIRTENDNLHAELSHSLSELAVANRELQLMIQRLEIAARTDDLTKLSNRRWLNMMLEHRWEETSRNGVPLAFMMIDLDGFKSLNDQYGHQKGDEILKLAARVIEANCRSVDISARFGGDEFCLLMPHADPESAKRAGFRISNAFNEAIAALNILNATVSMSIGIAHWKVSAPTSCHELVQHADEAMYQAKAEGSSIVLYKKPRKRAA